MFSQTLELQLGKDGAISVVSCRDLEITGGRGTVYDHATDEWTTFWEADGSAQVTTGQPESFGRMPFRLEATVDRVPTIGRGDKVTVYLYWSSESGASQGGFEFDDPESVVGKWIDNSGELSALPCED